MTISITQIEIRLKHELRRGFIIYRICVSIKIFWISPGKSCFRSRGRKRLWIFEMLTAAIKYSRWRTIMARDNAGRSAGYIMRGRVRWNVACASRRGKMLSARTDKSPYTTRRKLILRISFLVSQLTRGILRRTPYFRFGRTMKFTCADDN